MSQETKKMLTIIDKQHKEAYQQIQKENKKRRTLRITITIIMAVMYILMALHFIFIY